MDKTLWKATNGRPGWI